MQMPIFKRYVNVVVCVYERVRRLERILGDVEWQCENIIVQELYNRFESENIKNPYDEFRRQLVLAKYDFLKKRVKNKLTSSLVEIYLDTVLLLLTVGLDSLIAIELKDLSALYY